MLSICHDYKMGSLCLNHVIRKPTMWFPNGSVTNRDAQAQINGKRLEILDLASPVEGLCYPCSENKGADQLRSYCEADLRLCFRICKMLGFSERGTVVTVSVPCVAL